MAAGPMKMRAVLGAGYTDVRVLMTHPMTTAQSKQVMSQAKASVSWRSYQRRKPSLPIERAGSMATCADFTPRTDRYPYNRAAPFGSRSIP